MKLDGNVLIKGKSVEITDEVYNVVTDELKLKGVFIIIELIAVDIKVLVQARRVEKKVDVYGAEKVEL